MLKDKVRYGVSENVVEGAEISAPKKEYKASALDYKQLNELIYEATTMEDPSFLYLVVMSMTQGLRRGELCGLMWKDINWETKRVTICHNRVQLVTKDTVKLPKREKVREIELHNAGYTTLKIYKEWQEAILGRPELCLLYLKSTVLALMNMKKPKKRSRADCMRRNTRRKWSGKKKNLTKSWRIW